MKHFNNTILLIIFVNMVGIKASAYDFASRNDDGIIIYYNHMNNDRGTVEVTYQKKDSPTSSYSGNVVIPEYVGKYKVKYIGDYAFENCTNLNSITIPSSISYIGQKAFDGCIGLNSVIIYDIATWCNIYFSCSARMVNNKWHYYDYSNPLQYAHHLYINDQKVTDLVIPDTVKTIRSFTFNGCTLNSITIPNSVTSIEENAFLGCSINKVSLNCDKIETWFNRSNYNLYHSIKDIIIGDSVKSIGDNAFYGCSSLSSVIIGNSVTSIGQSAFAGCSSLSSVSFGNNVTTIGGSAFSHCSSLSSIILPNTVTNISSSAFWGTSWYDSQPDGLVYTGKIAYRYKGEMPENTKIVIKNGTTVIANSAFSSCKGLVSIEIPNSMKTIGSFAFYECTNLHSVYIDDLDSWWNIQVMGDYVFKYNYKYNISNDGHSYSSIDKDYSFHLFVKGKELHDLIVPNTVDTIRKGNFSNCILGSVTIPNHVKEIEEGAFIASEVSSLKINMQLRPNMDKIFGYMLQSIEIGNDVNSIPSSFYCTKYYEGGYLRSYQSHLQSITIGINVRKIAENAFSEPEHYKDTPAKILFLPNTFEVNKDGVYGRTWYTSDDYPLLSSMFEVDGIKYVPISLSERTCEAIDCNYSSSVKDVHIGDNVTYKGVSMRVVKINPYLFKGHNYIENLTIDLKKEIPHDAFNECINLKTAFISDNVTGIGSNAFYNCKNLITVSIGNGVDSLGYEIPVIGWGTFVGGEIFSGCNNLSTLNLSNGIRYIGYRTFHNCEALTTIKIPSSVTKISSDAFDGCKGLTSVHIDDMSAWCNISFSKLSSNPLVYAHRLYLRENEVKKDLVIPSNSVTRINKYAFAGLIDFTSLTIPPNVETIDDDAFYGCTNLASVTIEDGGPTNTLKLSSNCYGSSPVGGIYMGRNISFDGNSPFYQNNTLKYIVIGDKVTSIPDKAFSGCNSLNYVSIGASMKTIGQEAFTSVTELPNLICWAVNPPTCGSNALTDINKWTCRLQVPKQSLNLYKSADQWKDFLLVEDLTGIKGVHETAISNHYYDINGQFLLQPKRGVNIVKTSDGKTKKVVVK